MNKFFIVLLLLVGSVASAQTLKLENIKDDALDYGTIEKSSDGVRKIEVKNTGKKPLIISNVTSSCGCTVPEWTKTPIKPRKKGFINVKYNTDNVGAINKTITINSNDAETPNKIVKIKGTVEDKKVEVKAEPTKSN